MEPTQSNLESLPPEILQQVLFQLPAEEIVNLCRVSKYLRSGCHDMTFWSEKSFRDFKFPRDLFHRMILPNPLDRYHQVKMFNEYPNEFITIAARNGDLELVEYLVQAGATNLDDALEDAAESGHPDVVKYLIRAGGQNLDAVLDYAAQEGHLDIVRYAVEAGVTDLEKAFDTAVTNGYPDVVQFLIDHAGNDLDLDAALTTAIMSGEAKMVELLVKAGASDVDKALRDAASLGQLSIVKWLLKNGADEVETALHEAIKHGHLAVVKEILKSHPENYDLRDAAYLASEHGHNRIAAYITSIIQQPKQPTQRND